MTGRLRLALTGDSIITRRVITGDDVGAGQIVRTLRDSDFAFTNLEVLPNDYKGQRRVGEGSPPLAVRSWILSELVTMGFNLFGCANNHSLDFGPEGLVAALDVLEQRRISFAGIGRSLAQARRPVYRESNGATVAVIACTSAPTKRQIASGSGKEGNCGPQVNALRFEAATGATRRQCEALDPQPTTQDVEGILGAIRAARARAGVVLMSLHTHEQGTTDEAPADFVRAFARRAVDAGADIFVGHGPHLLHGVEVYRDRPIFYSLGNFIAHTQLPFKLPGATRPRFNTGSAETASAESHVHTQDDPQGFALDRRHWRTVLPICEFADGRLVETKLLPITLGPERPPHQRGSPRLAKGDEASEILARLDLLSRAFNTRIGAPPFARAVLGEPHHRSVPR